MGLARHEGIDGNLVPHRPHIIFRGRCSWEERRTINGSTRKAVTKRLNFLQLFVLQLLGHCVLSVECRDWSWEHFDVRNVPSSLAHVLYSKHLPHLSHHALRTKTCFEGSISGIKIIHYSTRFQPLHHPSDYESPTHVCNPTLSFRAARDRKMQPPI